MHHVAGREEKWRHASMNNLDSSVFKSSDSSEVLFFRFIRFFPFYSCATSYIYSVFSISRIWSPSAPFFDIPPHQHGFGTTQGFWP